MFSSAVPVYQVMDLSRATQWYRDVLGFEDDVREHSRVAHLRRDRVEVLFREGQPRQSNNPWDTYVRLTGVDALYDQIRERTRIRRGPEDTALGDREVEVRDDSGFVLTFGEWNSKRGAQIAMYDIHPVLAVEDVTATAGWYRNVLGFEGEPRSADFAMLHRDSVTLFLQQADVIQKTRGEAFAWDVYFRVDAGQIDTAFDSVKDEALVLRDPELTGDGHTEFEIEDCNGYVLCFGETICEGYDF